MARPGRGNTIPAFQKLDRISEQKWGLKGSIANMVVKTEQSQHFNFYNFLQSINMGLEKILETSICSDLFGKAPLSIDEAYFICEWSKTVFSSFSGKYVSIFLCVCCMHVLQCVCCMDHSAQKAVKRILEHRIPYKLQRMRENSFNIFMFRRNRQTAMDTT